jgi:hypothetical protein
MGIIRRIFGWLLSIIATIFVVAKGVVDYTGRTTFFEDIEALRGRIKPVLDWLENQPDIWFYGTQFGLIAVGVLIVFAPQIRARLWPPKSQEENQEGIVVPSAHLGAMQRYEGTLADLQNKTAILSALVALHARLCEASRTFTRSCGLPDDQKQIIEITDLIMRQMQRFVLPLSPAPQQGLRIQTGWNKFIQIFDVPMRIPPKIKITDFPQGSYPELSSVTTLSFEVKFWPEHIVVGGFNFEADARL